MSQTVQVVVGVAESLSGSHTIPEGWRLRIPCRVIGLSPGGSSSPQKIIADAEAALIAVIGDRGTALDLTVPYGWPPFLEGFTMGRVHARPAGTVVEIDANYRGYPMTQFRLTTGFVELPTNIDKDGNAIVTNYTYPSDYPWAHEMAGTGPWPMPGLVSETFSETSISMSFLVVSQGTSTALYQATQFASYNGKVNAASYTIGAITGAARTWKCTVTTSPSTDGGRTMWVEITLTYRWFTHDKWALWSDPITGRPPSDLVADVGRIQAKVIPETTFPAFTSTLN